MSNEKKLLKNIYQKGYSVLGHRGLGKVPGISKLNAFLVKTLGKGQKEVEVNGSRMMLHDKDSAISKALPILEKVEPLTTDYFNHIIKEGDTVLDLGANIGYFTLLFAKKVGQQGKVFAFEADPRNLELLKKNVEINGYENVVVVGEAVSDKIGSATLHLTNTSDSNSIYKVEENLPTIKVPTTTLDEYFKDYNGRIDAIKMDIQGAEYVALLGMKKLIKKNPRIKLICEFEPVLLEKAGVDPREFLQLLEGIGFEIYNINEKKRKIEKVNIVELAVAYAGKGNNTNLVCVKEKSLELGET